MTSLGHAERLVLAGSMCDIVPSLQEDLKSSLEHGDSLDYEQAWRLARGHKTLPLIARNFREFGILHRLPDPAQESLEQAWELNNVRNEFMYAYADRIVAGAAKRGVEVLVRKGLPLTMRAHGDRSSRAMADIDLLVRKSQVQPLVAFLREEGFESWMSQTAQRMLILGGLNYPTMSKLTDNPACPELHIGVSVEYFERSHGFAYDIDAVFTRADRRSADELPAADEIDFFFDVCAHFFKDAKSLASIEWGTDLRLYRFSDIARLARRLTGRALWPNCLDRAEENNLAEPIFFALWYAACIDAAALPAEVKDRLAPADRAYLHTYGETDRRVGTWPNQDVVGRIFDQSRAEHFAGTSRWAAMVPAEPIGPGGGTV